MATNRFKFKHVIPAEGDKPEYVSTFGFRLDRVSTFGTELEEEKEILVVHLDDTYDDYRMVPTGHPPKREGTPPEMKYSKETFPKTFAIKDPKDIKRFLDLWE